MGRKLNLNGYLDQAQSGELYWSKISIKPFVEVDVFHPHSIHAYSHPKPFDLNLKPRSADTEALVHSVFEDHPPPPTNAGDL